MKMIPFDAHHIDRRHNPLIPFFIRYGLALALTVLMILARYALTPVLGGSQPFALSYLAVALAVWLAGLGPGLLAITLGTALNTYLFIIPYGPFFSENSQPLARVLVGLITSLALGLIVNSLRRTRQREEAVEDSLRQSEAQLHLITDELPALIAYVDANYCYRLANRTYKKWLGLDPAEMLGRHVREVLGEESWQKVRPYMERARRGEAVVFEEQLTYQNDRPRWVHITYTPDRECGGRECGFVVMVHDVTERKLEEEERGRLAAIVSSSLDAIFSKSLDGMILSWNAGAERMYGYTAAEMVGQPIAGIVPPDREAELQAIMERLRRGERIEQIETERIRKDGRRIRVSLTISPILDARGRVVAESTIARDISAQHEAEEALRNSERRFRELADSMPQIIWASKPDGTVDYYNRKWYELTDAREGEIGDQSWLPVMHPDDRQKCLDIWYESVRTGRPYQIEYRFKFPGSDEYRWHLGRALPVRDEVGNIIRWYGTSTDIHDQKLTENRLRSFFDSGMMGVFYWTLDGKITESNDKFLEMVGYTRDDLENGGLDWSNMTPPEYLPKEKFALEELKTRGIDTPYEKEFIRKDGRRIPILIGAAIIDVAAGEGIAYILDITERKRAEEALCVANERLTEADRRKDEFLAMLAHELRNPLAPIRYAVQLLQMAETGNPQLRRQHDIIDRQVSHMGRLLDDLLDVSRITRGKIQLRCEELDLRAIAGHAVESMRPLFDERRQQLVYQAPSAPLPVNGDPTRLEQVLRNLLHNATKYTEPGGCAILTMDVEDAGDKTGQAVVRVRDSGVGIAPDMLKTVFEPFVQAEQSLARTQGGLGIGLSMVRSLVALHGGSVEAHSGGLGQGCEFVVRLPLSCGGGSVLHAPESRERLKEPGRRVLVVDDNEDSALSLAELLKLWGHQARTAHDGHEALALAQDWLPDAVLLDIGLPGMDGYEVAGRLRRQPGCANAMIIALTGYGGDDDRRRALESGFDSHLTKPVALDLLRDLLHQAKAA